MWRRRFHDRGCRAPRSQENDHKESAEAPHRTAARGIRPQPQQRENGLCGPGSRHRREAYAFVTAIDNVEVSTESTAMVFSNVPISQPELVALIGRMAGSE